MYRICFRQFVFQSTFPSGGNDLSARAISHPIPYSNYCDVMRRRRHEPRAITLRSIQLLSFLTIFPPFMQLNVQQSLPTRSKTVRCTMHYIHREMISHNIIYSSFILTKVSYSDNVDTLLEHYLLIKSTFKEKYK